MRTVLLASLRHHTRRYVASALAVVIGVGFIVAVDGLAGALREGLTADVGAPYAGASHVVRPSDDTQTQGLLDLAEKNDVAATPMGRTWADARTSSTTFEATVGSAALPESLRWQRVVTGRAPTRDGEALVDESEAVRQGLAVGDMVELSAGTGRLSVEVVGLAAGATAGRSDLYLTWPDLSRVPGVWVEDVVWDGPADVVREAYPEVEVLATQEAVAALQKEITQGVDVIALLVSLFAAIALGVAILVITNTFAILFAQRMRDFALLRCVGVTKRQLRRSVRIEALVLGVVAAVVGVLGGVATAYVITALVGLKFDELGTVAFRPLWLAAAGVVGVVVTLVAAWFPTRSVTRVSPLAALRPMEATTTARVRALRVVGGLLVAALGVVVLAAAVRGSDATVALAVMFLGGGLAFLGLLILGPVLVPAVVRLLGRVVTRRGPAGAVARLATSNAVRNPRRTATTTASLMVGVTLTTAVLTGLGTMTDALGAEMETEYPLDQTVLSEDGTPLPASVVDAVAAADGVDESVALRGVLARLGDAEVMVLGAGDTSDVLRSDVDPAAPGAAVVPYSLLDLLSADVVDGIVDGNRAELVVDGRRAELTADFDGAYGSTVVVDEVTLAELAPDAPVVAVWVRAEDGTEPADLTAALSRAAAGTNAMVEGDYEKRDWIGTQLSVMTGAVLGLLGVAVVIALIGIANTLGLSVLERTRESALLRAMGVTRSQLRRTLAVEGALLAGVATLLGVVVGLAFAWVGVEVMLADIVESTYRVPVGGLLVVVVGALASGVLASVLPSRKAARVTPAAGLSAD